MDQAARRRRRNLIQNIFPFCQHQSLIHSNHFNRSYHNNFDFCYTIQSKTTEINRKNKKGGEFIPAPLLHDVRAV